MAKNSVADWSTTAANNTDVGGVGITGNDLPRNLDDGLRTLMAQIAVLRDGFGMSATYTWTTTQVFAGADADGEIIVSFSTERPWHWRQRGSGANANLSLENTTGKIFGMSNDAVWAQHNILFNPVVTSPSIQLIGSGSNIQVNGNTVYHPGNFSVGALTAALSVSDIGGYVFARRNNTAAVTTGATSPGSELLYARLNTDNTVAVNVTALTGTWMLCGATHPGSAGSQTITTSLWKRVA